MRISVLYEKSLPTMYHKERSLIISKDAHNYVYFDCGALRDYEDTRQRMNNINNEPKFQPGMTDFEKMALV